VRVQHQNDDEAVPAEELTQLLAALEAARDGDDEVRLPVTGEGIGADLRRAFNELADSRADTRGHDLVATVSHELRRPVAAIFGAALTLKRDDVELDAELQEKLLEMIAEESSCLAEIVNNLLIASQLDTGTLRARIERCDPRAIARLEIDAARTHLPETIEVLLVAAADVPAVAADPGQLRQVLGNLIENAIKYSPGGGTIEVTIEPVDEYVRFAVNDTGLGIPETEQRRIFERFYRLQAETTRGIRGTGLGLYICRELVRRVDGRIWVESDGESGSTFIVEIPQETAVPAVVAHRRISTPV